MMKREMRLTLPETVHIQQQELITFVWHCWTHTVAVGVEKVSGLSVIALDQKYHHTPTPIPYKNHNNPTPPPLRFP